jgi:Putative beta-barrel porin-2, OmpL-like. bbp2
LGGNLTILATTHIGPETPDTNGFNNTINNIALCGCNPNSALRYLNDITATWKVNDNLTLITDLNYIRDDAFPTSGYGAAQYAVYKVNDWLSLVGRAEVWRDNGYSPNNGITHTGFFVAGFPGNFDFVNAEHGFLNTSFTETPTTYLELTAGLNISPPIPDGTPFLKSITFRPEVRYDSSLNGTTPFDGGAGFLGIPGTTNLAGVPFGAGTKSSQVTFGGDIVAKF